MDWVIDSVPDLVLSGVDSVADFVYRVQGLRGLPDGGLLVVNGGSRELWFLDSRGRLQARLGGDGEGPGEFRDPVLVPSFRTDSLLIFDKRLPRVQLFSLDGQLARATRHENGWPYGRRAPLGSVSFHDWLFEGSSNWRGREESVEDGVRRVFSEFFWYDPDTGESEVFYSVLNIVSFRDRLGSWNVPFVSRAAGTISMDGATVTPGDIPEIRDYDTEGRLRGILRVDGPRRMVTREMVGAQLDRELARLPRVQRTTWERVYREMPIPDSLPYFQSLRVDEVGWLWAEIYEWDPDVPREWMVFDPEGRAHGTVRMPEGRAVGTGPMPAGFRVEWIGRESILGIWTDELGVETVRRYALRKGSPPVAQGPSKN